MFCRYACEYCDSKFSSKASRKSHEKSNHVDGEGHLLQIDCKECEKKLPTPTDLRKHITDRHGSKVKCCDKSFNRSGYKQHRTVAHVDKKEKVFKVRILCFKFSLNPLIFSLTKKLTQK